MKFTTAALTSLAMLAVLVAPVASLIMEPPSGGDCWGSTLQLVSNEIGVIFNPRLYNTRRTYIMCPTTIVIGHTDPVSGSLITAGDFPLFLANPNVEIKCLEPGTCILEGGDNQIGTLGDRTLIAGFLAADPANPPLPEAYLPDASGLIIDGMTFSGASGGICGANPGDSVVFAGPGQNMTIVSCIFTNQDTDLPPRSGVRLAHNVESVYPEGKEFYSTVAIKGCTFENNIYRKAVIGSQRYVVGAPPSFHLTIEDTFIGDTVLTSGGEFGAIISLFSTVGSITDTTIVASTSFRSAGTISLFSSNDVTFENVVLVDNFIDNKVTECKDVSIGTLTEVTMLEEAGSVFAAKHSFDSCLELGAIPPPITMAPAMTPTMPPVNTAAMPQQQPVGEPSTASSSSSSMSKKKKKDGKKKGTRRTTTVVAPQQSSDTAPPAAKKSSPHAGRTIRGSLV